MKGLFKLGLFAAIVAGVVKLIATQKAEWQGLTEPEVRDKLQSKLGEKVPADKLEQMGDKVIEGMRRRGVLGEDAPLDSDAGGD